MATILKDESGHELAVSKEDALKTVFEYAMKHRLRGFVIDW